MTGNTFPLKQLTKNMVINTLNILHETMADGPGLRDSLYCSGCYHRCPGCHNPESWDIRNGIPRTVEELAEELLADPYTNITFSGGDPLYQVEAFTELARLIKERSHKTIWLYTGFTWEQITSHKSLSMILPYIDVIVEGPFIKELRNTNLMFRGSSNQRIIDVKTGQQLYKDEFDINKRLIYG